MTQLMNRVAWGLALILGSVVLWILGGLHQAEGAQWLEWGIWPVFWLLLVLIGLVGLSLLAVEGVVGEHVLLQKMRTRCSLWLAPDVVGWLLGVASGAFIGWHFALRSAFVCADSGAGTTPLLCALFFTGAAVWLGTVWVTAVRKASMAASMPGCLSCLWWGGIGSVVGGWSSALLADHALLTPALALLKNPEAATGLVAVAAQARVMVLAGMLMGAASGVCLAWHLHLYPSVKKNLAAGALAAAGLVAALLALRLPIPMVLGGSVAGLNIRSGGVMVTTMDVLRPGQEPITPVGQVARACGPGNSIYYASFRDGPATVEARHIMLFFLWR